MEHGEGRIRQLLAQSLRITKDYFKARLIICLILGGAAALAFALLGIPLFGILGAFAGICNIIPMFGPWISAITIGVGLLFYKPVLALYAVFVILGTQVVDELVLTPLLMGKAVDLKPLTIIVVVMAAGSFLGFWGILFALPVAASVKAGYILLARPESGERDSGEDKAHD